MKRHFVNSRRHRGAVVIFTAVGMVTLVAFAALAIDLGYLFVVKAELQSTADAAALAGAGTMFDQRGLNVPRAISQAAEYAGRNLKLSAGSALQQMDVTIGRIAEPFTLSSPLVPVTDETANAVRTVVYRDRGHGNPVPLWFANIFGNSDADVSAVAVAGLSLAQAVDVIPAALRTPDFGTVDPDIYDAHPGKDGPSYPSNGEYFEIGEKVTVFTFGKGPRQPVHLVLDIPDYGGVAVTDVWLEDLLYGDQPPVRLSVGDQMPVWNMGTGDGNFGQKLWDRIQDSDPLNDTVIMPVVDILPESRDSSGRLTGNVEIVDFVGVHLDEVIESKVQDPRFPDDPTRTIVLQLLQGTVVRVVTNGVATTNPAGYASSVFALQLLR